MSEDENSWIFDSLICFLNGPVWNAPLQSFIEEKSLIFEPNNNDNEDYKKIFEEFKNLVDLMLGSFMEDIGISSQQFEEACINDGSNYLPYQFDQVLFEQIWAANDYEMFKRMMAQRNVELQLQALELIEQRFGITPDSFIPKKKGNQPSMVETKAEIARSSKEEHVKKLEDEKIMEEVKQQCSEELMEKKENEAYFKKDVKFLEEKKQKLQETLESTLKINEAIANSVQTDVSSKKSVKLISPKKETKSMKIDAEDLQKRQEYLKSQRDKLVALKKQARKKQLDSEVNPAEKRVNKRPQSAKAAEAILNGTVETVVEPQQLQIRKALAQRLKAEVVSKTN